MRVDERIAALRQVDVEIQRMEVEAHQQWSARMAELHIAEAQAYERLQAALTAPDSAAMRAEAQTLCDTLESLLRGKKALGAMLPTWTTQPGAEALINRRERLLAEVKTCST